jgi:hypothetical protein
MASKFPSDQNYSGNAKVSFDSSLQHSSAPSICTIICYENENRGSNETQALTKKAC